MAGAAAALTMRHGVCERARLTASCWHGRRTIACARGRGFPRRDVDADKGQDAFAAAAEKVMAAVEPSDDVHASAPYRRHLAGVMTQRALEMALARAGAH